MVERYEFIRTIYKRQEGNTYIWAILIGEEEKVLEIEAKTNSPRYDLLNFLGKEGWHYGAKSDDYDYLQRKVTGKEDC